MAEAREAGQASVELVAGLPALLLAGLLALNLLGAGYATAIADGAVEAAAMAIAAGEPPEPAAAAALPGWARDRYQLEVAGGRVEVAVRPPSVAGLLADVLELRSSAWVRPPEGS